MSKEFVYQECGVGFYDDLEHHSNLVGKLTTRLTKRERYNVVWSF